MNYSVPKGWKRGEQLVYVIRPAFKGQRWAIARKSSKAPVIDDSTDPNECYALDFASGDEVKKFAKWWYQKESASR